MKKILLLTIALALSLTDCKNDDSGDTHTHEWEWQVTTAATATAEGLETETCKTCGATNGTRPIAKLPNPNESTITAFGRDIAVKGDASISAADFNTAKEKLQEAMVILSDLITEGHQFRNRYDVMLNRTGFTIIIETGNAAPDADANKSITVGVDYLLGNDVIPTDVATIINQKVASNAFAE